MCLPPKELQQNNNYLNPTTMAQKAIYYKGYSGIIGIISFLYLTLSPLTANAFSLREIILNVGEVVGVVKAEQSSARDIRSQNIQTIEVFEPDKNAKSVSLEREGTQVKINDTNNLSFEVGTENFYAGESLENNEESLHTDNAIYKVQKGDSIYSIGAYFSISPDTILGFNKISVKGVVPGIVLEIPPVDGVYYEVKKGDTLRKLADRYKVELDDITLFNGLLENESLAVGQEVFVPGAVPEKKEEKKPAKIATKNRTVASSNANLKELIDPSIGNLAAYIRNFGRGSTAQNSKISDLKKYASLPKYPGYYTQPAPGTTRTQTVHGHNGSDFAGKIGTPVIAAAGGTVRVAKSSGYNYGYGNYIIIAHANGSETVYAHLSRVLVSAGEQVGKGAQIGAIGSSGNSTGPHLHFEIRGAYNPWAW